MNGSIINNQYQPNKVLYPASGHDNIPSATFGKEKVVHTSLEAANILDKETVHFPHLDSDLKIVAQNQQLPFTTNTFDVLYYKNRWLNCS